MALVTLAPSSGWAHCCIYSCDLCHTGSAAALLCSRAECSSRLSFLDWSVIWKKKNCVNKKIKNETIWMSFDDFFDCVNGKNNNPETIWTSFDGTFESWVLVLGLWNMFRTHRINRMLILIRQYKTWAHFLWKHLFFKQQTDTGK